MPEPKVESGAPIRSVERAMALLKVFTQEQPERSLGEIAREAGLPKSTVRRFLTSLESGHFIEQDDKTGKYKLGYELIRLGITAQEGTNLARLARPDMELLSLRSEQSSNLYILRDFQRICIAQIEGPHYVRRHSYLGALLPLYAGASGKVLLAFSDISFLERYLREVPLLSIFESTITDEKTLRIELQTIRNRGYGYSLAEREVMSASVSAPIFNLAGNCVAAITVSGPVALFTEEAIASYGAYVIEAGRNISKKLGFDPSDSRLRRE